MEINYKQKAWEEAIEILNRSELIMLETGRIRNPNWKITDGDSTNYLSKHKSIKTLYSLDNDSENFSGYITSEKYCRDTLSKEQLDKIIFVNGDSTNSIKNMIDVKLDVVLLDSANNPEIIYNEFINVIKLLNDNSLVIIDDVTNPGLKGDKVLSLLRDLNIFYKIKEANPSDCAYFILDKDKINLIMDNLK